MSTARTSALVLVLFSATHVGAEPAPQQPHADPNKTHSAGAPQGRAPVHHRGVHHRNHLSLFLGNTHEEGQDGFTIGGDYEFRLSRWVGVGGQVEYARDFRTLTATGSVFVHPFGNLRLLAGAGGEHEFEADEEESPAAEMSTLLMEPEEDRNRFVFKVGALYDFVIGRFTITPTFEVDMKSGTNAKVFGVSFGYEF